MQTPSGDSDSNSVVAGSNVEKSMVEGKSTKSGKLAAPQRRIALVFALGAAFTLVAIVSGVAYLFLLYGATVTTEKLLHDRTHRLVEDEVRFVKDLLDPIVAQLELFAVLVGARDMGRTPGDDLPEDLTTAVIRMPGVTMAEFYRPDRHIHRVVRALDGSVMRDKSPATESVLYLLEGRLWQAGTRAFWSPPLWSAEIGQPVIKVGVPIEGTDGTFSGAFIVTVPISELSRRISDAGGDSKGVNFILVDQDKVLAYPGLVHLRGLDLSARKPLPTIDEVDDSVLAAIWSKPIKSVWFSPDIHDLGHVAEVNGAKWLFVHQRLSGYGPIPWLVGRYFPIEEATGTASSLVRGTLVGAATLVFAFVLGAYISFKISRLIGTITSGAKAISQLRFDQVHYQPSHVQEIDEAGHSLDKARDALRWFGAYIPQGLVRRLMDAGEAGLASREQVVTVMFTDIVQFSQQTRGLPVGEVADLLNQHFAILGGCIERQNGIVDKFIGDAVMAVWGGIAGPADHADSGVRAALDIVSALKADNAVRRRAGKQAIQIRIGIHTGPVVAGNIGLAGRVNYTVVGDTVNVAQHLERIGKELMAIGEEAVCLVSVSTIAALQERSLVDLFRGLPVFRFQMDTECVEYFRVPQDLAMRALPATGNRGMP